MNFRFAERKDVKLVLQCIDFYLSLGAKQMSDWTVYRITGDVLNELGRKIRK